VIWKPLVTELLWTTRAVQNLFVKELRRECNSLREMPERFAKVRRYSALRKKVHGNYLIMYDCGETNVEVIRILHGRMDYEAIFFPQDGGED
jgi:toxin ParE1/3/4